MPGTYTYPGMYVEEIPSGVHPIAGVSMSDTAFIDFFLQGPMGKATRVTGFDDFLRRFGPLDDRSPAGFAVQQYFVNGGQVAWIVRVAGGAPQPSQVTLVGGSPPADAIVVSAIDEGKWGDSLQIAVDWATSDPTKEFNLVVRRIEQVRGRPQVVASEVHRNLTMGVSDRRYALSVVAAASSLISLADVSGGLFRPNPTGTNVTAPSVIADLRTPAATLGFASLVGGDDGAVPGATELGNGLSALERIEPAVVNLLCIPAAATLDGASITATPSLANVAGQVADFCDRYRAFYILDIPSGVDTPARMTAWLAANSVSDRNAAVYFPRVRILDPLADGQLRDIGASGTIAGLYARTDSERGIWIAPAGTSSQLRGVTLSGSTLNDSDSGLLNPLGVNVLRNLPVYGNVSWGARTLDGADIAASEWKYVPVRRMALYLEESLVQGLRWVVFEPNDESLWGQIRLNVGAFMQSLFRKGAFRGRTPREAYLVKCDGETTTQGDIDRGIVNILVGFAPLNPAEFVVIQIQQLTLPPEL
jgi:uncharacterized protein